MQGIRPDNLAARRGTLRNVIHECSGTEDKLEREGCGLLKG